MCFADLIGLVTMFTRQRRRNGMSKGQWTAFWTVLALSLHFRGVYTEETIDSDLFYGHRLKITDCEQDFQGEPSDCNKIGFFVNGFTNRAVWIQSSGIRDMIPSGRAFCCRPSLPDSVFTKSLFPENVHPTAIVSVGCHLASNNDQGDMSCEASGNSLVTGFAEWFQSASAPTLWIPGRGAECCLPTILLSSGEAWSLERCNCADYADVNCPEGKLLLGYSETKNIEGHNVPTGYSKCCDVCLGRHISNATDCSPLNDCNGNGACLLGSCECFPEWVGEDCGRPKRDYFADPAPEPASSYSTWLWGSLLAMVILCYCCICCVHAQIDATPRQEYQSPLIQSLLNQRHDIGSVGSVDTRNGTDVSGEENDDPEAHSDLGEYKPLLSTTCTLCSTRPVQVALVPCGHSNVCRKCSRKLEKCPFCREDIIRRQRLYLNL